MIFEINGFPFSALLGLVLLCSPLKGNHPKMGRCSHWHPPDSLVRWWELLYSLILVARILASEKKGMTKIPLHESLFLPAGLLLAGGTNYNSILKQWRGWHAKLLTQKPSLVARFPWVERRNSSILFTYLLPLQISIRWRETLKMVAMWAPYIFFHKCFWFWTRQSKAALLIEMQPMLELCAG